MKKMRTHSSWRAAAPLLAALALLAGLAPTIQQRSDNFNNNALANFWSAGTLGPVKIHETNQRLEFSNSGPTGALSAAGVLFNKHGINWKKNFHIEWDYRLNINTIAAPKAFFMGTALPVEGDFPDTMTGLICGLLRDVGGLWIVILVYDKGAIIDSQRTQITQKTGKIEIDWNKAQDRMTVKRKGGTPVHYDGYYALAGGLYGNSPMAINQGIVAGNGNINFKGHNVYMDNWTAEFYRRNFVP